MADAGAAQLRRHPGQLIASLRHTVGLLLIQGGIAAGGAYMQFRSSPGPNLVPQHQGLVPLYVSLIILEWALVRYVWAGVRKQGGGVFELIGGRWTTWKDPLLDLAIALPFWVVWEATARLVHALLGASEAKSVDVLLPQGTTEVALWFALSASAGICEEIVFRGYFQKQFRALTGSVAAAVLLQAIVFGAAHAYQGLQQVIVITVLGALYGLLACWCGTLRPGMIAHSWSDIYGGYFKFL